MPQQPQVLHFSAANEPLYKKQTPPFLHSFISTLSPIHLVTYPSSSTHPLPDLSTPPPEAIRLIYVYAFCPSPPEPLVMPEGIASSTVQLVLKGALGAIAEFDLDVSQLREDDEQLMKAVLSHDRVLGQLFTQTMLLPLRFGTQFTSEASLHTYLQTHQDLHRQRLETLANKAEYLIKLTPKFPELPSIDDTLKGRDYFLAKKRRLQTQTQTQTQQVEEFEQFLAYLQTVDTEVVQSEPNQAEERLYILSSRDPAIATAQFSDWQQRIPSWQLYCSEPLPPYHFAT